MTGMIIRAPIVMHTSLVAIANQAPELMLMAQDMRPDMHITSQSWIVVHAERENMKGFIRHRQLKMLTPGFVFRVRKMQRVDTWRCTVVKLDAKTYVTHFLLIQGLEAGIVNGMLLKYLYQSDRKRGSSTKDWDFSMHLR